MKSTGQAARAWAGTLSWVALALADLAMLSLLFPPSPTRNKEPDLSGGFALNQSACVGVLLLVSLGARLLAPVGDRRRERKLYWIAFGATATIWVARTAQQLLL